MTWKELVHDQIDKLEKEKSKELKKLEKYKDDYSPNVFAKKIELESNIKSITEAVTMLYILLGRANEVTE